MKRMFTTVASSRSAIFCAGVDQRAEREQREPAAAFAAHFAAADGQRRHLSLDRRRPGPVPRG